MKEVILMKDIDKFISEAEKFGFSIRKKSDNHHYVTFDCNHCGNTKNQIVDLNGENVKLPIYCDDCIRKPEESN